MKNPIQQFLNRGVKAPTKENAYVPKIRVQSTVDYGKGMNFNEKAQHIFGLIKQMK